MSICDSLLKALVAIVPPLCTRFRSSNRPAMYPHSFAVLYYDYTPRDSTRGSEGPYKLILNV